MTISPARNPSSARVAERRAHRAHGTVGGRKSWSVLGIFVADENAYNAEAAAYGLTPRGVRMVDEAVLRAMPRDAAQALLDSVDLDATFALLDQWHEYLAADWRAPRPRPASIAATRGAS